ncbi:YtpI family protein [Paenibacillus sp. HB172176]|uniref:YtpI family protein n=1 Tax=Paenibacillus sp. HB172176 TaxID=2493690 RepID=UPI00143BD169|nr:YtpI family protein [Paenibacillus sp. HB172176]
MDHFIQWLLFPLTVITLTLSALFSLRSRRAADQRTKGINSARMNISMGAMLIFLALIQLFLSDQSTLRIVIGALFIVIGVFNLFAGLRNLSMYRQLDHSENRMP